MSITSIYDDLRAFLATILAGERIDIIGSGEFLVFAMILTAIFWAIFGKLKKYRVSKTLPIIAGSYIYIYYFTLKHFPLELMRSDTQLMQREGMLFGQFWYPFYQFDSLSLVFDLYHRDFAFMLALGFVFTICSRKLYRIWCFLIFDVGIIVFEILFVVLNNICHHGLANTYDLGSVFIEVPAMLIGFVLARVVIRLNGGLYEKLHEKAVPKISAEAVL